MERRPLYYKSPCTHRKATPYLGKIFDSHQSFLPALLCMEVRGSVIAKVHPYDDPVEAAKLRHCGLLNHCHSGISSKALLPVSSK